VLLVSETKEIEATSYESSDRYTEHTFETPLAAGETATLNKFFTLVTDRDHTVESLSKLGAQKLSAAFTAGFSALYKSHIDKWAEIWKEADIEIEGDVAAQQGIRFNIFHMKQTYNGEDPRLNIGPKGFTGEKYGGSTYWDTEAYCLPFYLSTSHEEIPRNLLVYRYNHLERAIENASKLGLKGALYPMVTMNGEECHNEWEITFEEIHRNAAIAYAIFNYIRYTGDSDYLVEYGLEVLLNISRFWADRVNYNPYKDCYMMLGVTGPNEYENNVNNNWYTNLMASWTLEYTLEAIQYVNEKDTSRLEDIYAKYDFNTSELETWTDIIQKIYLPEIEELGVFAQQDGYLDKEQILVSELDPSNLPLNQKWSWDKILRSCFIKQADVLQGIFFLSDRYDTDTKRRNFDFYEPRTVHESSLSPCVYSIVAGEIGYHKKAYELYQRSARLDLDNYNNDTDDGLHITSMAGTWMSVVYGFGGFSTESGVPKFAPFLPENWSGLNFHMLFRNRLLVVKITKDQVHIDLASGDPLDVQVYGQSYPLTHNTPVEVAIDASRAID
jgi:maltose phosphorylase